jgi:hypothetical protein
MVPLLGSLLPCRHLLVQSLPFGCDRLEVPFPGAHQALELAPQTGGRGKLAGLVASDRQQAGQGARYGIRSAREC